jgi:hypothetical protein
MQTRHLLWVAACLQVAITVSVLFDKDHGPVDRGQRAVWGTGPNDVYAVGEAGSVLHLVSGVWVALPSGADEDLHSAGGGSGEVYAVGGSSTAPYGASLPLAIPFTKADFIPDLLQRISRSSSARADFTLIR